MKKYYRIESHVVSKTLPILTWGLNHETEAVTCRRGWGEGNIPGKGRAQKAVRPEGTQHSCRMERSERLKQIGLQGEWN